MSGVDILDLTAFDIDGMNFRLKKVPRIYRDIFEKGLKPTQQSVEYCRGDIVDMV